MGRKDLELLIHQILRKQLGVILFERAEVEVRPDHDGDEAIYIKAFLKPGATTDLPSLQAMGALRQQLLDRDEERFPYLSYVFPDDEVLIGDDA